MRVAYVTTGNPRDLQFWSGSVNRIARCLQDQGMELHYIGPLREAWGPFFKAKHAFHRLVLRQRYTRDREPVILRGFARQVQQALQEQSIDAVVSPGTIPIAKLDCPQPIITWTDATFPALLDYYPRCSNVAPASVRMGMSMEREALRRVSAAIFSSNWAAESAVRQCGADPAKVHVIPFGAILADPPDDQNVETMIAARPMDSCRLLFIGVEWLRKGGDVALEAARMMNEAGIPTELQVVGCDVPPPVPHFVRAHGYVNKFSPGGREKMNRLFAETHFLIMPSLAEAYGLAPCEANAYGVPAITSATGGLNEVVRNGANGFRFELGIRGATYAQKMLELLKNPSAYRALCRSARQEYETRLNWDVAGSKIREVIEAAVTVPVR